MVAGNRSNRRVPQIFSRCLMIRNEWMTVYVAGICCRSDCFCLQARLIVPLWVRGVCIQLGGGASLDLCVSTEYQGSLLRWSIGLQYWGVLVMSYLPRRLSRAKPLLVQVLTIRTSFTSFKAPFHQSIACTAFSLQKPYKNPSLLLHHKPNHLPISTSKTPLKYSSSQNRVLLAVSF